MFYLIGIGLGDCKDITVKGLEIVKKCKIVYIESYTSMLSVGTDALQEYYGRDIIVADREMVEQGADDILEYAKNDDVAMLVIGDPFSATTHTDIILRAKEKGIKYEIIHNASIINAVGCTGLQLYSFGETISIPFWTETWKPDSFMTKIVSNYQRNLHTLCLLDIRVKEQTVASIMSNKKEYEPTRFMTVDVAATQLLEIIEDQINKDINFPLSDKTLCIGVARVGSPDQQINFCTLKAMKEKDLGKPLHSLVIPAPKLHPLEEDYLKQFTDN